MERLLNLRFQDRARAGREIADLTSHLPPAALNRLDLLLSACPAPEQGLQYFARLREQQPASFQRLTRSTAGLRYLIAVFAYSHFLSEEVLEHPEWVERLLESGDVHRVITADEFRARLEEERSPPERQEALL